RVGAGCVIRDSEIGADTEVFPHCVIDGARIGPNCNIGPFARFRPRASLSGGVHIGNFVEVKNSELGAGSKANHLAYVGDAQVGAGATIAAGSTVTRAVPAGGLTVARARQVTVEKWRRPTKNPEKNKG